MEFKRLAAFVHLLREREPVLPPEDADRDDDFVREPDDLEEPPDRDPEADLLADEPAERPFEDDLLELLPDDPLFEDEEREVPLFDEDEREVPLFEDAEDPLRFDDEEPADFVPEELRLDPDDEPDEPLRFFAPEEEPDELLRFEPDEELLLPPDDLLPADREEPLFDEDFERPFPPPALLREVDDPPDPELRDPPRAERPPAPAVSAMVDCTTFAAPSTAPIAAPAMSVPAASAALASKPSFLRLPPLRDELVDRLDEVLFFPFVVAIFFPLPVCNAH